MLPNFEPEFIFGRMASWLSPGDRLLFSANLAPGPDLEAGVRMVLPQYDNPETKAWLRTLLEDHGVSADCGSVVFHIEPVHGFPGCARIAADWVVSQSSVLVLDGESFPLLPGERLRLSSPAATHPAPSNSDCGAMGCVLRNRGSRDREKKAFSTSSD